MPSITSSTQANYSSTSSNIETNKNNLSSPITDHSTEHINPYIQDEALPSPQNQQSAIEDSIHMHTTRPMTYLQKFDEAMAGCEITEDHPSSTVVNFSESVVVTDISASGSAKRSQSQHSSTTNDCTNRINYYVQDPINSIPEESPYLSLSTKQIIQAHITKIQNNLLDFDKSFHK